MEVQVIIRRKVSKETSDFIKGFNMVNAGLSNLYFIPNVFREVSENVFEESAFGKPMGDILQKLVERIKDNDPYFEKFFTQELSREEKLMIESMSNVKF
jgi:hypothetical protein